MTTAALARIRSFADRRERVLAAVIALAAGALVFLIATEVFPYHSSNHDEGVYLQQSAMLLEGQLNLFPGGIADAVRPWFFVEAGDRLYPKYQPLPAGFYAIGMALFGEPRVILAAVAACNTALVYVLGSMTFDRRVGLISSAAFALAPMTLVTSAVFLPYAPTTLFNLAFAALYLRSVRTGSWPTGALAGLSIGVAFFMRPFTAVLFATPFLLHALLTLVRSLRERVDSDLNRTVRNAVSAPVVRRLIVTAFGGLAFVLLSLVYNAIITGNPLLFPYEAFAPLDGPGFGYRKILSHDLEYTPAVALQANGFVLRYLLTRWVFAGVLGTALAIAGFVAALRGGSPVHGDPLSQRLLAGLFVSVPAGNVLFWGNYNILSTMSDPTDGLLGQFGPFYHFDLLAPMAIFTAAGAVAVWRHARPAIDEVSPDPRTARAVALAVLAVSLLVVGGFNAALATGPLERNAAHTATYEDAYGPFEDREFENAAVFLPTPYGDFLNHPFQFLRNDPGFDDEVVYALDRGPASDFSILDRFPDRQFYRYDFRGEWTPSPEDRTVEPTLHQIEVRGGERLAGETMVAVPGRVTHATVRIETTEGYLTHDVDNPGDELVVDWAISSGGISLTGVDGTTVGSDSLGFDSPGEAVIQIRLSEPEAGSLTYRQELTVRERGRQVEVVWPPERTVCPIRDDCGREGTYVPENPRDGIRFQSSVN